MRATECVTHPRMTFATFKILQRKFNDSHFITVQNTYYSYDISAIQFESESRIKDERQISIMARIMKQYRLIH